MCLDFACACRQWAPDQRIKKGAIMPVHNADIAAIFDEIADLLEIAGDNPFRIRAYRRAARTVGAYGQEFKTLLEAGTALPKLPGIGTDLAAKIQEIVASGHCARLDELRRQVPANLPALLKLPGLGPKRVKLLNSELGITNLAQLKQAAQAGQIRTLAGLGAKTEQRILNALASTNPKAGDSERRFLRPQADQYARSLLAYLRHARGVKQVVLAGSYRRLRETVGDLDILVTAGAENRLMQEFLAYDEVQSVLEQGITRSSVLLKCGLQVDLRLVSSENYGAALHYFTGSKAHNIAVRRLARARGLKLNEYGVFRGKQRIAGDTEESVFESVGLPFIEPELREDRGEIDAARRQNLPQLITRADLRGDLHVHSKASDGRYSIEEMVAAAQARGLQYLAITDHTQHLTVAHGLDPGRLAEQIEQISKINAARSNFVILCGSEVDILEDGRLDLPDTTLQRLDLVLVAIHSKLDLPRQRQTERLLRAMENPYVRILAHPSGRLLGQRAASQIDWPAVLRKASERHIALELNSQPDRLDLDDVLCKMARDAGVLVSINSDAHSTQDFANLEYGIGQARRGWLEAKNVLNTRTLTDLKKWLQVKPGG